MAIFKLDLQDDNYRLKMYHYPLGGTAKLYCQKIRLSSSGGVEWRMHLNTVHTDDRIEISSPTREEMARFD